MMRAFVAAAATLSFLLASPAPGEAGPRKGSAQVQGAEHPNSSYYRGGPRVKGYVARRGGGYSYSTEDTINTYGDSRSKYGAASSLRDPSLDRQTNSGPFDHGFFFDSGNGFRGGEAPYMN